MAGTKEVKPLTEAVFYILLSLYQPNHGYGIMQFLDSETDGRIKMGPGTLYGALGKLVDKGWISMLEQDPGERKKEYIITSLGKKMVEQEIFRLVKLYSFANRIVLEDRNATS